MSERNRVASDAATALRVVLAVMVAFWPMVPAANAAMQPAPKFQRVLTTTKDAAPAEIENYDVRADKSKHGREVVERYRGKVDKERKEKLSQKKDGIGKAKQRLEREIPGLALGLSEHTGAPELVRVARGRQKLTEKSKQPREQVARGWLQKNADLFGLTTREVAQLRKTADYSNPAGNLSWVEYQQEINGRPVFRGDVRFAISSEGELVASTGNLVPGLEDYTPAGKNGFDMAVPASAAVVTGALGIGVAIPGGALTAKETSADGNSYVFDRGPFADDVKVELHYFPVDAGVVTPAWSMIFWQEDVAYWVYVSAEGGELLWRKNLANDQSQPATYVVYDADSPAPLSPSTATPGAGVQGVPIPRTSLTRVHEHPSNNLGWIPDGASITTGNNVDAGLDLVGPDGIDAGTRPTGTAFRIFDYAYNPGPGLPAPGDAPTLPDYRNGEISHMFFWSNRYHDRLYELGFTEAARNFQQDNFGRGGLGNDRVRAEAQDGSGTNNANFLTPPDGTSGRMQMYVFTGPNPDRTSALDQDVLLHELTHGTSNRLHNNAAGLSSTMSGGMGEGWSDFYARALTSGADEDPNGVYAAGAYATQLITAGFLDNYYYGIRRFPYSPISNVGPNGKPWNPLTFADIDPTQINVTDGAYPRGPIGSGTAFQVHNIGEVWASALFEVRARLLTRLGWAAGNQLALQLVTDGMKLDPVNPTLLQGRDSILAANAASGGTGETELDIWRGFAARGMGFSAKAVSSSSSSVVEAFDLPNAAIGAATILSDSCDNGGVADPGETIVLSVPVTNPFNLTTLNNVVVTIGSTAISVGTIAPGATGTYQATVTIPSAASCGSHYLVPVTVMSDLGTVSHTISLQLGLPTSTVPEGTFTSGNIATPLPDVATVEIPVTVTASGPAGDVKVGFRLNHTFDGDLDISLVAPDGTVVLLSNNRGGGGDNFGTGALDCSGTHTVFDDAADQTIATGAAPFAGSFKPDSPLAAMRGREMNGVWKLRIADTGAADVGTIGCVTLEFTRQLFFCCGVAGIPIINAAPPATMVEECTSSANGAPDPGEVVTMSFPLRNVGSGLTTNLVATLRSSGGITSLGGAQSYGVLSPVGAAAARPFTFSVSSSQACGSDAVATFDLTDGATNLGSVSFNVRVGATVSNTYSYSNPALIKLPGTGTGGTTTGMGLPYPSTISVSGVSGTVVNTKLTLRGFSHTWPSDVDVLLVGPGGEKFIPLSDVGGSADAVNLDITLDDAASAALSTSLLTSGSFRPTNSGTGDVFPAPAATAPYLSPATAGTATFASAFGGTNPNGTWSLYAIDDTGTDVGQITNGWELTFVTADPSCAVVNAPVISGASVDQPALWPPNHSMREVNVTYGTGTDCATCALSVTSSEAVNGTGDGDTGPDWQVVDARKVLLRAERAGNGPGRIYTITITCNNGAGVSVQSVPVYVAHNIGSPDAGAAFRVGTPIGFSGSFWDVAGRRHTARWSFDNLSTAGSVVEPSGSKSGSVTGSYTFAEPGVYRVAMNVTDDRNVTASITNAGDAEAIVVVYDPNGGYVLGGGWFASPAGKLTFGYNSKYTNSKNPKGEAQFSVGSMSFDASSLDYLTIAGARAQVAGSGKLNGDGPYEFLLSMIDGDQPGGGGVDRVRVKVWHKVTGQVIYDSQPGASDAADPATPVGAGSRVVIQK